MGRRPAKLVGCVTGVRDIAVLLLALSGCAPGPPDLRVTFVDAPPRAHPGELRFQVFFTEEQRACDELEAMVVPQPSVPSVTLTDLQDQRGTEWPAFIELHPQRGSAAGRVFGVVLLSKVPHATFCSGPVRAEAASAGAAVHLLRTRPGPSMTTSRIHFSVTPVAGGRMLAVGNGGLAELSSPGADDWSVLPPLFLPRYWHAASALADGRVLIIGGLSPESGGTIAMPRVEAVDPLSGESTLVTSLERPRALHSAVSLRDGRVLVTGGTHRLEGLASAELYDPDAGTWTLTGPMAEPRSRHTTTLLPDGTVLIAGGWGAGGALASTELYDPASGTFGGGPQMQAARVRHVAVLLADGSVLVAGGNDDTFAERYVPEAHAFVSAGALALPESDPCAARLPSGQVALVGEGQLVHLYQPADNSWSERAVLSRQRRGCAAWPAPHGGLMVAGGDDGDSLASTEVVEP